MNQATNLVQLKNLEKPSVIDFNKLNMYEIQGPTSNIWTEADKSVMGHPLVDCVYRLKICDDEWYYYSDMAHSDNYDCEVVKGSKLLSIDEDSPFHYTQLDELRPATKDEIPKPVPADEELVGYLCGVSDDSHGHAESNAENIINCFFITGYSSCGSNRFKTNMDRPNFVYAYPVHADSIKQLKNYEK